MEKRSLLGKITLSFGFLLFLLGFATCFNAVGYTFLISNKTAAYIYIGIGLIFLIASNFFKKSNR